MSTPFRELLRRRRAMPMDERLPDGSSVDDLLRAVQQRNAGTPAPSPDFQVLTPTNQAAITRPRTVTPTEAPTENPIATGGFRGAMSRPRRAEPRDFVADDAAYYRDLQRQPRTWRDKLVDVIDAVNIGAGGKPRVLPTRRERALQRAGDQLGLDVEMQKQELNQMVPVTLDDGTQVMVPRRTAGTLQSNQQNIARQNADSLRRKNESDARIARWERMDVRDRRRLIADLYKSGGLNDPNMLEYAADELGIPGTLREKFIGGQMRDAVDANGNLIQVNRQTNEVTPVTQGGQPVGSYQKTLEAGRNRRAVQSQEGANYRAGLRGTGGRAPAPDRATNRRAAVLIGQIDRARSEMEAADTTGDKAKKEAARMIGEQAASELNALGAGYEAGRGEGGYPYYKKNAATPQVNYAGRTMSQANLERYAKDKGLSVDDARKQVEGMGVKVQ